MKQFGLFGKGTGKLGSSVFAINSGTQIVRQYNPVVANPSTPAQVEQRSKLKLMSQLAASLQSAIAIPREGLKSSRNIFTSLNIKSATYNNGTAEIDLASIKVTNGSVSLKAPFVSTVDGKRVVNYDEGLPTNVEKIAWFVYKRNTTGELEPVGTKLEDVIESDGVRYVNGYELPAPAGKYFVYSYGMVSEAGSSSTSYDDYNIEDAAQLAKLASTRALASIGAGVTKSYAVVATVS